MSDADKAIILMRALVQSRHWPEEGHAWGLLVSESLWSDIVDWVNSDGSTVGPIEEAAETVRGAAGMLAGAMAHNGGKPAKPVDVLERWRHFENALSVLSNTADAHLSTFRHQQGMRDKTDRPIHWNPSDD